MQQTRSATKPGVPTILRSLIFMGGYVVSTLVFAPLSIMTFPLPFLARYAFISQWAKFNLWWLRITCGLSFSVEGKENIPPQNGIVLCKHQSAFETLALQSVFPPQVWLLKRELLWIPFFGWGLAMLEPIAIHRGAKQQALAKLINDGIKRLQAGRWVVIFPEGTRMAPGEERPFALGGALLAERSAAPVVPVAHNAGEYWPKRSFIKHPGVIRIVIGPVIDSQGRTAKEINALAKTWIDAKMRELSPVRETLA